MREDGEVTPRNSIFLGLSEGTAQVICLVEEKWREKVRQQGFELWIRGAGTLPNLLPFCYVPQRSGYNSRISFRKECSLKLSNYLYTSGKIHDLQPGNSWSYPILKLYCYHVLLKKKNHQFLMSVRRNVQNNNWRAKNQARQTAFNANFPYRNKKGTARAVLSHDSEWVTFFQ